MCCSKGSLILLDISGMSATAWHLLNAGEQLFRAGSKNDYPMIPNKTCQIASCFATLCQITHHPKYTADRMNQMPWTHVNTTKKTVLTIEWI